MIETCQKYVPLKKIIDVSKSTQQRYFAIYYLFTAYANAKLMEVFFNIFKYVPKVLVG